MKPSVLMYIGIFVAMFIVVWGISVLYQHYVSGYQRKKADIDAMHTWVPLHLDHPADEEDTVLTDDPQEDPAVDLHSKTQQNGHYSQSKHTL